MTSIRLGAGAGFSGDRIDSAVDLVTHGNLDYLIFECLAERTIALAQQARRHDPDAGYDPLLLSRMRAVLPLCHAKGVKIITNMGAANPQAAVRTVHALAQELGLSGLRLAAVTGDDVLEAVVGTDMPILERGTPVSALPHPMISANAYLGAAPIVQALASGADVVITGRAADPALFLAPLVHEFGWAMDDWHLLGCGTLIGHLLECAGQITGGYFADPGHKDVPDLARLGMPIGEVFPDGSVIITKTPQSGGQVTPATCKEQLLYEIHDPCRYLQPDVVADFSQVSVQQVGPDQVRITGATGHPKSGQLKVSLGFLEGWVGEGQISYAGSGAANRGRLALDILHERVRLLGLPCAEVRGDLIGLSSVLGFAPADVPDPYEVRVRFAARTEDRASAEAITHEVDSLYLNGPAGGGGVSRSVREIIGILSVLLPEADVHPAVYLMEV